MLATPYGQVLGLKILAVLGMVPLSVLAWRRVLGSPRLEAGVAVMVIGAAALLAAFALPPGRAAEAERAKRASASISALPRQGDLTLGGAAGQVLVGLTIRPARPGTNEVLVYLLPLEGEDAAGAIPATVRVGGRSITMDSCGATCRRAELDLQGGEALAVAVGTDVGGTASFQLPDLPAPDGSEVFDRAQRRMHELGSYRLDEALSSGLAEVRSTYAFLAPNSYTARVVQQGAVASETIVIGGTRYLLTSPDGPWKTQTGGPELTVPSFIWDSFMPAVATKIIGSDRVHGVRTEVISLSGSGSLPIWFRLWVDDHGLSAKLRCGRRVTSWTIVTSPSMLRSTSSLRPEPDMSTTDAEGAFLGGDRPEPIHYRAASSSCFQSGRLLAFARRRVTGGVRWPSRPSVICSMSLRRLSPSQASMQPRSPKRTSGT